MLDVEIGMKPQINKQGSWSYRNDMYWQIVGRFTYIKWFRLYILSCFENDFMKSSHYKLTCIHVSTGNVCDLLWPNNQGLVSKISLTCKLRCQIDYKNCLGAVFSNGVLCERSVEPFCISFELSQEQILIHNVNGNVSLDIKYSQYINTKLYELCCWSMAVSSV